MEEKGLADLIFLIASILLAITAVIGVLNGRPIDSITLAIVSLTAAVWNGGRL